MEQQPKKKYPTRGFASMSPEKRRAIASLGGKEAHRKGMAHEWTSEEARQAGKVGGATSRGGRGKLDPVVDPKSAAYGDN